jgi:uncharacterized protein YlxW (UPF0749 family)
MDSYAVILSISAAILSGMGTAIISGIKESRREETRKKERYQDHLKLEVKDLKIQLYQLERDLIEWKDKYYDAIQELISVKAELEEALIKLSLIDLDLKDC